MATIEAKNIEAGMTITYADETAQVVKVTEGDMGLGYDLHMDNGEVWFIFERMTVELVEPTNEVRVAHEVKPGWKVGLSGHGVVTVSETDRGRAAGINGILIGGTDSNGKMVWAKRSRFTSIIRYI